MEELTDEHRALLDFEARPWRSAALKEVRAREELGLSATRYYQVLRALLGSQDAEAYAPQLVHRLRRQRDRRAAARRVGHGVGQPAAEPR